MIGNSMGENNPALGKRYLKLTALVALPTCAVWISSVYFLRNQLASIYFKPENSEDAATMHALLIEVIEIMCLVAIFDESQGYLQGALRALGLQTKAAVLCIISYWVFALPLAALFAFKLD